MVVGHSHLGRAIIARVHFKAQRVPAPFVRILQLGAHGQHDARPDEERKRFQLGLVVDPAPASEAPVGPVVIPAAIRQVDLARAAWLEHRRHQQIRSEQVLVVDVVGGRVGWVVVDQRPAKGNSLGRPTRRRV